jgi:hypothetical protein
MDNHSQRPVPTPFTFKAIFCGSLLTLSIALGSPYANMVIRGSYMSIDFSTAGAMFLFFVLTGGVNVLLAWISPALALKRGELLVVYIMMITASAIPTMGLAEYLLPIITAVNYFATPENEWGAVLHPHLPEWIVPQSPEAIKWFYEGAPAAQGIPWEAWIRPLAYWGVFVCALYVVMISAMVILRRQWVEHERLIFPLVLVPLEMVRPGKPGDLIPPFFKNPVMWAGFALPAIVSTLKGLHAYYNFLPSGDLVTIVPLFRNSVDAIVRLSFPVVGFTYLINLDIAFSLWSFNLLGLAGRGLMRVLGIASTEQLGPYAAHSTPILAHQGMGAMLVLTLFGLWVGREHLLSVFSRAFGGARDVDDGDEILSYRGAVGAFLGGTAVMTVWLWLSGLPLWAAVALLALALLVFVGLTRIVVEGGLAEAVAPMVASAALVSGVGSSVLGVGGMLGIAFNFVWAADIRTFVMASCAHGLKLCEHLGTRVRPLFWIMLWVIGLSFAGSIAMILYLCYKYGGINLNPWFFADGATNPFTYAVARLNDPVGPHWGGWLHTGVGALIMAGLMWARHHIAWWPLHPLGFPVAAVWIVDQAWFSIFLAWLIKGVVMRYGGPALFRKTRPFFLGLIVGQYVIAGVWLIIDYFTEMTDNVVFWI